MLFDISFKTAIQINYYYISIIFSTTKRLSLNFMPKYKLKFSFDDISMQRATLKTDCLRFQIIINISITSTVYTRELGGEMTLAIVPWTIILRASPACSTSFRPSHQREQRM